MQFLDDQALVQDSAERLYGNGQPIWDADDRWNAHKRSAICRFAERYASAPLMEAGVILDAGCGSEHYSWLPSRTISFDRFAKQLRGKSQAIAGDLSLLPFQAGSIDFVVCVASVLNYVSAAEAISEISRVLRPGGGLLLHYESSRSFEHLWNSRWGASVARIDTINNGREDTIWVYSPTYVSTLLSSCSLQIVRKSSFHIASALGLRLGLGQQRSATFAALDSFLKALHYFSDDVIILAEKRP